MAILVVMSLADLLVSLHLIRQLEKLKILLFTILFFVLIIVITIPIMNNELKFSKLVTEANSCFSAKNYKKSAELYDDALSLHQSLKI
ncbi:hypothetical protein C1144_04505 [Clostridium botulinum]|nr:hypothetical protein C1144_04505 [Clostridium botulinum]